MDGCEESLYMVNFLLSTCLWLDKDKEGACWVKRSVDKSSSQQRVIISVYKHN